MLELQQGFAQEQQSHCDSWLLPSQDGFVLDSSQHSITRKVFWGILGFFFNGH